MEIKYEAVFGDQALFDRNDAPDDCEIIGDCCYKVTNGDVKVWNFSEKKWCKHYKKSFLCLAMRRIIRTPTWTVADQKAWRLPEVGCLVVNETGKVSEVATIKNGYFVLFECGKSNGPLIIHGDLLMKQFKPIESPEEKAARLREEWVDKAWSETAVFAGVTQDEHDRLRIHLRNIYRAQLSGELAAPKGGE